MENIHGLHLKKKNSYIEKVSQKSGALALLAYGDSVEVLIQEIKKNTIFFIEPDTASRLIEFYYILEGSVICETLINSEMNTLESGDYFYVNHLSAPVSFKTLSKTKLLYVSSKPVFKYLSNDIKELKNMLQVVESKDEYTHSHGKRVRDLSFAIGNKAGLNQNEMENLTWAALLHDIGKIDIPGDILKKPTRLTKEEFEIIKKHPVRGAELVEDTFLEQISTIIEQHHERIDGSGYPYGLKNDEILLEAKILAVTDSFDAMTSKRPYREAIEVSKALDELRKLAGVT
ncbi:MAG: HD-GYP domain-containing protein, partial [Kosmotogaceae bacterium]